MKTIFVSFLIFVNIFHVKVQEVKPRIVGGFNVTSMEAFNHQVSIREFFVDRIYGYGHICGGSLISCRTVLTAGA
jgi:secreted trypsin-like serine protease